MTPASTSRLRDAAFGLGMLGCAALAAVALHQRAEGALAPNEAIAVIPPTDGIVVGTPVRVAGFGAPIGQVTRVARRSGELVLRLQFNRDTGIERRRGDGVMLWGLRGERSIAIVRAPSYEKPRTSSDTLYPSQRDRRRPASVEALLAGLYRGTPTATPDSTRR
jgi:hypothetical protein